MQDPLEFGIVMTTVDGRIERFLEKPSWGQVFSDTINTGIYILEPEVLDLIPPDQPYDFSSELFPAMLDKGLPIFGFVTDDFWTDVGTAEAFLQAQRDALARRVEIDIPGFELRPGVWVGEDVEIDPSARINGPALIGDNCRVGAGATIGDSTVIGTNTIVGDDADLSGAVVMDRAQVGSRARIRAAIIGRESTVHSGATIEEGAVLGEGVTVGAGALIKRRVKVYPSRTVDAGAIVTQSVVHERRARRTLFGARGVSGSINIGITPLVAARLGMAYGTMLPRGSVVVTARDASRAARAIKRAIIAGLNSTGVTCHDLELMSLPLTRFTVRSEQASGGISVRTSPGDPQTLEIRLFDADGADLPDTTGRKIERIYFREDFRRPSAARLGELEFPPRALEQYVGGVLGAVDAAAIRELGAKVVLDYAFGALANVGPSLMGRLGCNVLGLNGFTDEHRPVLTHADLERLQGDLVNHVRDSGSALGVLLEPGGEIAHLVDDRGRLVSHEQALMLFIRHESSRGAGTVVVPVSCSTECANLAEANGATVQWAPISLPALMHRAARPGVGLAGNADGTLIFPDFMPAPDGMMTFLKTLELLGVSGMPLSDLVDELPRSRVVTKDVAVPWEAKGAVMREVAASAAARGGARLVLFDGVKVIEPDRWALVVPLPDDPICRVWAEAPSAPEADALAESFAAVVARVAATETAT